MDLFAELTVAGVLLGPPMFIVLFLLLVARPKQEPYLRRVAKKYSVSPLNLR